MLRRFAVPCASALWIISLAAWAKRLQTQQLSASDLDKRIKEAMLYW